MALRRIILRDFVLVQSLDLALQDGFNVLTGETGAGKSILLEALQLAMGARAETQVVREGASKADISAVFDTTDSVRTMLDELGVEPGEEGELLLRRTIDIQGKSRGWINGTPVTATQLRALGALLVDIHGQHAWQSLLQPASTRQLLDAYGRIDTMALSSHWHDWTGAQHDLELARQNHAKGQEERERLQWQLSEISRLNPIAGEWESLNEEHQRLAHAKDLLDAAQDSLQRLEDEHTGALRNLHQAQAFLQAQRLIRETPEFRHDLRIEHVGPQRFGHQQWGVRQCRLRRANRRHRRRNLFRFALQQALHFRGGGQRIGAVVVVRGETAQRRVELRRQQ